MKSGKTIAALVASVVVIAGVCWIARNGDSKAGGSVEPNHTHRPADYAAGGINAVREVSAPITTSVPAVTNTTARRFSIMEAMDQREVSLTNAAFQGWASNYMFAAVGKVLQRSKVYGMAADLASNKVTVKGQIYADNAQITLETPDLTSFVFDNGAIRKIEVLSILPQGSFDERFSMEQRSAAVASFKQAPDKVWSDDEVRRAFEALAGGFGITPSELAAGPNIERVKVKSVRSLVPEGAPQPTPSKGGADAFITVTLKNPADPENQLLKVTFRTEPISGGYQLSLVELVNHNFKVRDPSTSMDSLGKFF